MFTLPGDDTPIRKTMFEPRKQNLRSGRKHRLKVNNWFNTELSEVELHLRRLVSQVSCCPATGG